LYSPEKNFFVAIFKCIFLPQKVIIDNRGDFQGRVKKAELGACAKNKPCFTIRMLAWNIPEFPVCVRTRTGRHHSNIPGKRHKWGNQKYYFQKL